MRSTHQNAKNNLDIKILLACLDSEKVFATILHHMYDGLHHKLMPLFASIFFLFLKAYFSESVTLTILPCTEFLTQENSIHKGLHSKIRSKSHAIRELRKYFQLCGPV